MTRYRPEHKEATRRRIVAAAAALFREQGVDAAALPEIMQAAGLSTVGGFYRHFDSKDELFLVALEEALAWTLELLRSKSVPFDGPEWIAMAAAVYLHPAHRDNVAAGCPLPALTAEVARRGSKARQGFQQGLGTIVDAIETKMPSDSPVSPRQRAWAFLATLVGGLLLARGVESGELAAEILTACRKGVAPELVGESQT